MDETEDDSATIRSEAGVKLRDGLESCRRIVADYRERLSPSLLKAESRAESGDSERTHQSVD